MGLPGRGGRGLPDALDRPDGRVLPLAAAARGQRDATQRRTPGPPARNGGAPKRPAGRGGRGAAAALALAGTHRGQRRAQGRSPQHRAGRGPMGPRGARRRHAAEALGTEGGRALPALRAHAAELVLLPRQARRRAALPGRSRGSLPTFTDGSTHRGARLYGHSAPPPSRLSSRARRSR